MGKSWSSWGDRYEEVLDQARKLIDRLVEGSPLIAG